MNPITKIAVKFMLNHKLAAVSFFSAVAIILSVYRTELSLGSSTLETINMVMSILAILGTVIIAAVPNRLAREAFPELRKKPSFKPVGVNEPCPCGSGKKYKKCCMKNG